MKKVIITGGTGFIGISLARYLSQRGFLPVLVARHPPTLKPTEECAFDFVQWDAERLGEWINTLNDAHAMVNLAGRSVNCVKTPEHCDEILRSRVVSTRLIGNALRKIAHPPKIWIQMSTTHIYGDPSAQVCAEDSMTGYGLAPDVGRAWEHAFWSSKPEDCRGVLLRTSFVLGKNGGALDPLRLLVRLGFGGKIGTGRQGISWIHINDLNELIHQALMNETWQGMYIASAPNPVPNAVFMRQLRHAMQVIFGLSSPTFIARAGSKLIFRTDPELALYGRYVKPRRLIEEGFYFKFPTIESALNDVCRK